MMISTSPQFPNTEWSWAIEKDRPASIIHPSGVRFLSTVIPTREDRFRGLDSRTWPLNSKDVFFTSYVIDYLMNKSKVRRLSVSDAMVRAANLMCSYRFMEPLISLDSFEALQRPYRKLGEHRVRYAGEEIEVFVIGHNKGTLLAVVTQLASKLKLYQLIELPREYFEVLSPL